MAEIDELKAKLTNIRTKTQQIADNLNVPYTDGEMTLTEIGNLLEDCREELIEKIVGEDTEALRKSRQVRIGTLVRKYGDFQSHRVFLLNDFKAYLLNCFIES